MSQGLWDPNSSMLLRTIVCYADILGFREMTKHALESGNGEEFLCKLRRSLGTAYKKIRESATYSGNLEYPIFDLRVFTDNIIVACPLPTVEHDQGELELYEMLSLFAFVQASLAADGFFLRGAITEGYHYQDQDVVFGNALLEAIGLDRSGGGPRLVIGPSLGPLIAEHILSYGDIESTPHYPYLLEDPIDNRLFINYLGVAFEHFPGGPIWWEVLAAHQGVVSENLREYRSVPRVREKYVWAATYHNYVCSAFASRYRGQGAEETDDEWASAAAETRYALEYLIPSKEIQTEQSPRPLSVERVQRL